MDILILNVLVCEVRRRIFTSCGKSPHVVILIMLSAFCLQHFVSSSPQNFVSFRNKKSTEKNLDCAEAGTVFV